MTKSGPSRALALSALSALLVSGLVGVFAACSSSDEAGANDVDSGQEQGRDGGESGYVIKGTLVGLRGSGLVLRNNGKDDVTVASTDTTFTFPTKLASGAAYEVTVATQPSSPTQSCTVSSGSGTAQGDVANITVTCTTGAFSVGGTINGLRGTGLVLQNNGGDDIAFGTTDPDAGTTDGGTDGGTEADSGADADAGSAEPGPTKFLFSKKIESGGAYAVTVLSQPQVPSQTCAVTGGSGTMGGSDVNNVNVDCTVDSFSVGGSVTGLTATGLVLQNKGGDDITVNADGTFTFPTKIPSLEAYAVTVKTRPAGQACEVTNGKGSTTNANVTNVTVTCANCSGDLVMGACWYESPLNTSCNEVCATHGGFDSVHAQHAGNPVCSLWHPEKGNGKDWETIECCSTDNNTNWGANNATPDPTYKHVACHLACACLQ